MSDLQQHPLGVKIKVTSRCEINGKVQEKSAEAEIPDDGCTNEDTAFHARAAGMASALFESMNPPMVAVNHEATKQAILPGLVSVPPVGDITALMLIMCDNGIISSGYCVMGWSSASFVSRPANLIVWLKEPSAELRALAEDRMKTFPHSRTINAYANQK